MTTYDCLRRAKAISGDIPEWRDFLKQFKSLPKAWKRCRHPGLMLSLIESLAPRKAVAAKAACRAIAVAWDCESMPLDVTRYHHAYCVAATDAIRLIVPRLRIRRIVWERNGRHFARSNQ